MSQALGLPGSPPSPPHITALPAKKFLCHFSFYTYNITFLQQSSQTLLILLFHEKHFSLLCLVIELDVLCFPTIHVMTRDLFNACCSSVSLSILNAMQEKFHAVPQVRLLGHPVLWHPVFQCICSVLWDDWNSFLSISPLPLSSPLVCSQITKKKICR